MGGILSGFFGGLSGHQGAFRCAFLLQTGLTTNPFIATTAAIASLVDLTRLSVYGLSTLYIKEQIAPSLMAAVTVAAFAGVLVGKFGMQKVTIGLIQKLVAIMLLTLGFLLASGIL